MKKCEDRTVKSVWSYVGSCGLVLVCLAFVAGSGPAFGEAEPGAAVEGRVILERCADFYGGLKSVSGDMEVRIELPEKFTGGMPMEPMRYQLALEKPVRAVFTPAGDRPEPIFVQDGKQQYTEMTPFSQYMLKESTTTLAGLAGEGPGDGIMIPGASMVVGFGLAADAGSALRSAKEVTLLGEEMVGEAACHHLALKGGAFQGEVWVQTGDQPWILRCYSVEPPDQNPEEAPAEGQGMMIVPRLDFHFSGWQADPDLAGRFKIQVNEEFKKVEQFTPPGGGPGGPGDDPAQDHPSMDKPAPEVTLYPLDGEPFSLSSLKGKVVVLDFWATWCKPCVMGMPGVAALAKEMEGREVVFFAVNQMESREKVTAFLAKEKLELRATLDSEGKAARAFGVRGIPHLVVIGPDGVVRQVHIGYAPGADASLKKEVEVLLK